MAVREHRGGVQPVRVTVSADAETAWVCVRGSNAVLGFWTDQLRTDVRLAIVDTLAALTLIVSILLGFQAVLDVLRSRIFNILGARTAARLGQPVLEAFPAGPVRPRHGPDPRTRRGHHQQLH